MHSCLQQWREGSRGTQHGNWTRTAFPPWTALSPFTELQWGWGGHIHTRGCCPHPRTQLIGSKGHLTQAGPIKSLPWEFGTGAKRRVLKKRVGVWSLWVSGPARIKPGVVHRVSRSTEEGGEREKGERGGHSRPDSSAFLALGTSAGRYCESPCPEDLVPPA